MNNKEIQKRIIALNSYGINAIDYMLSEGSWGTWAFLETAKCLDWFEEADMLSELLELRTKVEELGNEIDEADKLNGKLLKTITRLRKALEACQKEAQDGGTTIHKLMDVIEESCKSLPPADKEEVCECGCQGIHHDLEKAKNRCGQCGKPIKEEDV